jgi:3-methyladenine DNA glycosylase AlkD
MSVVSDLQALGSPTKAKSSAWFFKSGPGQYGEGDIFIGVTVPEQRVVAKRYRDLPLSEIEKLLSSPIHEHRLTALMILVLSFDRADVKKKKEIYSFYLTHAKRANNWDLVDTSAQIVGKFLLGKKDRSILVKLARSKNLWERRIAIVATHELIGANDFVMTLHIAEMLLKDTHDLIHKAVGWMLREVGKRDEKAEEVFLQKHYKTMPRTMLRYAIERFSPSQKAFYMKRM